MKIGFDVFRPCFPQKLLSPQGAISPVHCIVAGGIGLGEAWAVLLPVWW